MFTDKLRDDLKNAMKSKDAFALSVLRMLTAALGNRQIEKRGKGDVNSLTDEETLEVLTREAKKRKESALAFAQGGREDLKEKETKEAEFIARYLPKQMSGAEVEEAVKKIINKLVSEQSRGASADFGLVMKEAMKELKGKADGKIVSEIIKKLTA